MVKRRTKKPPDRLTQEVWLEKALEILRQKGNAGLQIESFTRELGVTKGSFYWHFKDRRDFRAAILDYWEQMYTRRVIAKSVADGGTARQRLRCVVEMVARENLSGYDEPIDGWAAHEPVIADRVQESYDLRYKYVRSLFSELGFKGVDLETRTVACLGLLKAEWSIPPGNRSRPTRARIDAWMKFFTGR